MKGAVCTSQSYCFQLSVNSGEAMHLVQVFRLSIAAGRTGSEFVCEESRAGGGLGRGGLATYQAGPPTHCLTPAVHSPWGLLFPGAGRHSTAGAGTLRCQASQGVGHSHVPGGKGARVCSQIALGPLPALGRLL